MSRDYGAEIDALKEQLQHMMELLKKTTIIPEVPNTSQQLASQHQPIHSDHMGKIHYSGQLQTEEKYYLLEPQERDLSFLLKLDSDKAAKILSALGHKQRLDIIKAVASEPMSGVELVERLNMGTTGQLYHHLKALLGADLITQDERGGKYLVSTDRVLPLLMLLTAVSDLLDTSDYLDMSTVRDNSGVYLGKPEAQGHDVHNLLWATLENSILEHKAGYCTEIDIFLHEDASVTVSDNGRGIPVRLLPDSNKTVVQSMLTDVHRNSVDYLVPGGEKGVSIAVVNALSQKLTIEVKKDGHVYRQEYRNGIPQTGLIVVGVTKETGTSVTFKANPELFSTRVNEKRIQEYVRVISMNYPDLSMRLYEGNLALDQSGKDGDGK